MAAARAALQEQVIARAAEDAQLYLMNMPTGSGKTLASMRVALLRALKGHKKRIIYVIPYTSIIEQNARIFKDLFGAGKVLEHHSKFDFEAGEDDTTREKLRHAAENWDASIVGPPTSNFSKASTAIAAAVCENYIILPTAFSFSTKCKYFPDKYYQPCLEAIGILVRQYNSEALFLSATMPDFSVWLREFGCGELKTLDLIPDKSLFPIFSRCQILDRGELSLEALVLEATQAQSCLIVVNTRKTARAVYEALSGNKFHRRIPRRLFPLFGRAPHGRVS